ncbi:response regulator transcription factor [Rhodococcus sp. NPDC058505]|uniref:response regulator transcription factor n=1 Tax=Rhodococcus sp. NPDC058505 TaxID=3346531 RepID=UPI003669383A
MGTEVAAGAPGARHLDSSHRGLGTRGRALHPLSPGGDMTAALNHHLVHSPSHAVASHGTRMRRRPQLSAREVEVLLHWLRCDSKNTVAADLYLSIGTVNTHLARIRTKYREVGRSAPTKAALVARAVQDGLISLDEL